MSYERAVRAASKSINGEQMRVVYSDSETEQDEVMDFEQSELEEQMPSAKPVYVPDKKQTETGVEPSVRESLAVRQQSDPELGKLVRLRLQSAEQPALALLSTESESAKRLYNQWERLEVREGSYDEELKEILASSLIRSCSFLVSQFKTCSAPVTKE